MPIFGWTDTFSRVKEKKKLRESQTAVERSFKVLRNMWLPPLVFNETGDLGLDMLLLLNTEIVWNTI